MPSLRAALRGAVNGVEKLIFEKEKFDFPRPKFFKLLNQMKGNSTDNCDFFFQSS